MATINQEKLQQLRAKKKYGTWEPGEIYPLFRDDEWAR